jgi:hypothetical protein
MRPRKIVSLSCYSAQRRSELRIMLDVWGYAVLEGDADISDAVLIVTRNGLMELNGCRLRPHITAVELREWLRVAAGRKRGPMKQVGPVAEAVTA